MKTLIFSILLFSQFTFALGITDFVMNAVSTSAQDLCKKLAKVDQPKCDAQINGKVFRREFVSVCAEAHKKFRGEMTMQCLEAIENKSAPQASSDQAEVCESLVKSYNQAYVLRCLKANVTAEFSNYCKRFVDSKEKLYETTAQCMYVLSDHNASTIDMKHFFGCKAEAATRALSTSMQCVINAEAKKSGGESSTIVERIKADAQQ